MSDSRWLDADAAADHLSLRIDAFYRAVRQGRIPPASRHLGVRTPRWDRDALDAVMAGETTSVNTRAVINAVAEKIKSESRKGRTSQVT